MKQINKLFNYLILFLVAGYGLFFFLSENTTKSVRAKGQIELSSNDVDQAVNKYLKQTTETIQKDQVNSDRVLYRALNQPINLKSQTPETNPAEIPASRQIWKDVDEAQSPADLINTQVYDSMALQKQDEQERKQYAHEFIENARRGGFHVVLSDDLSKIVSVTPIRKPSQDDDSVETNPSN